MIDSCSFSPSLWRVFRLKSEIFFQLFSVIRLFKDVKIFSQLLLFLVVLSVFHRLRLKSQRWNIMSLRVKRCLSVLSMFLCLYFSDDFPCSIYLSLVGTSLSLWPKLFISNFIAKFYTSSSISFCTCFWFLVLHLLHICFILITIYLSYFVCLA